MNTFHPHEIEARDPEPIDVVIDTRMAD